MPLEFLRTLLRRRHIHLLPKPRLRWCGAVRPKKNTAELNHMYIIPSFMGMWSSLSIQHRDNKLSFWPRRRHLKKTLYHIIFCYGGGIRFLTVSHFRMSESTVSKITTRSLLYNALTYKIVYNASRASELIWPFILFTFTWSLPLLFFWSLDILYFYFGANYCLSKFTTKYKLT